MKIYFTLEELIEEATKVKPELDGEDLEQYAKAGHVETDKGFIWFTYWQAELKKGTRRNLIKRY